MSHELEVAVKRLKRAGRDFGEAIDRAISALGNVQRAARAQRQAIDDFIAAAEAAFREEQK